MRGFIFLVVNLVFSSVVTQVATQDMIRNKINKKNIAEINKDSVTDDILKAPIQRSSTNNDDILWPSPVPYDLDDSLDTNAKGVILRAFEQFRLKSCIDFKERDSEQYYIKAQKLNGCYSYIGRVIPNGQDLSIGQYCDEISTVEHEFLHALGFYHEQSRYDRDNFVTIILENVREGFESNFDKVRSDFSTTEGTDYDFSSVMHYGEDYFTNGNGSTIITKDPKYQKIIGQRLEMSPTDVWELNLRYYCNSTIAFQMYCDFSDDMICQMNTCSQSGTGWERSSSVAAGPTSDHTSLTGNGSTTGETGFFMYTSTASGEEGDSARMETKRMTPKRDCNVQCLQFYYYHSGSESDQLNIWIREFEEDLDVTGTVTLMGQITGAPTAYWQIKYVSLNTTKAFQVEFEARKGEGASNGGFSIDDINLSETECPHVTIQVDDFENLITTGDYGHSIVSPRQYSSGGYAYSVGIQLYRTFFGLFVQLMSGDYDDELVWPVPQRMVSFKMVDQTPIILDSMSMESSMTSDTSDPDWGNPREIGTSSVNENNETIYRGPRLGQTYFATLEKTKTRQFLKGGSAVFAFSFQDLTPLEKGDTLPCPELRSEPFMQYLDTDEGPCSSRNLPTTTVYSETTDDHSMHHTTYIPPLGTTDKGIYPTTHPSPPGTTDERVHPTTHRPPHETTEDRIHPTTHLPLPSTTQERVHPTTHRPPHETTEDRIHPTTHLPLPSTTQERIHPTTHHPSPRTTDERTHPPTHPPPPRTTDHSYPTTYPPPPRTTEKVHPTTHLPPPQTTDDDNKIHPTSSTHAPQTTEDGSIFGFSPGLASSPLLAFLLALMLLIR